MQLLLTVLAIISITPAHATEPFLDVVGHPHAAEISVLQNKEIIAGYGSGIFRPDILINRAEFLKILLLARYKELPTLQDGLNNCFIDFTGEPEWYWPYACYAKELGIVQGYPDGTFKGANKINLAEALKIIIVDIFICYK